jgi:hypothetical protein
MHAIASALVVYRDADRGRRAHSDSERLLDERATDLRWLAHLRYLRDLRRVRRKILSHLTRRTPPRWDRIGDLIHMTKRSVPAPEERFT